VHNLEILQNDLGKPCVKLFICKKIVPSLNFEHRKVITRMMYFSELDASKITFIRSKWGNV
jgi:hypothetical protein